MSKSALPIVTVETIQQVGELALKDNEALFREMAASNPDLYRFAYDMHQLKTTNKTTMLGVLVAVYTALERQAQKGRKSRKRLRHNDSEPIR